MRAPRARGCIKIGCTTFMFMTLVPGATLEARWHTLSAEAKQHIQRTLEQHYFVLCQLDLPPGEPFGPPVGRRACKDVRRDERLSSSSISTEAEFNDFLLSSPSPRAAPGYKTWIRSMIREDHRTVFTHADLHPRNVMVVDGPDGKVEVSGIIEWEVSGYYPEYWEHMKAMNTRSIKDTSDWWEYLPPCILGYDRDIVLDRILESTVVY
ncbi:hypothetical protein C8Q80DRAFT_1142892 [Daedaleopsis nitida]|nr:hypothetical protein C8Q80DRAFT_1142892 [Daedaleopsis nitida]